MSLVQISNATATLGGAEILVDVSLTLDKGNRYGVVGRNGAGKTTLFRLVMGDLTPERGTVTKRSGLRISLLDQHRDFGDSTTVWGAVAAGHPEVFAAGREVDELGARLAEHGESGSAKDLKAFGRAQDRFAHLGGYDFHVRVDTVLQGLGFDPTLARVTSLDTLSGGERGRLGLAAQLVQPADVRLFDEPTNHLDLDTARWLTEYLTSLNETVMVISHDRAFLEETVDHVAHVHHQRVDIYTGNYSSFVTQRAERALTTERAVEKQRAFVAKEEEYIRRHIAGQNSAQAKGRRKRLARLPRLSPPPGDDRSMSLTLTPKERGGNKVIEADQLGLQVEGRVLLKPTSLVVMRQERIAVVGKNGAGKSTLLATILGARPADSGSVKLGAGITPAWYRQDLDGVPLDRSIFDVIHDLRPQWNRGQVQDHLGKFRFVGDEAQRRPRTLSGGERARVALAMITLSDANLLVLDEPTNHLDVEGIEALQDAIDEFAGTVLLVSHDRQFLRELATRVWTFEDEEIEDYPGTFTEWEIRRDQRASREAPTALPPLEATRDQPVAPSQNPKQLPTSRSPRLKPRPKSRNPNPTAVRRSKEKHLAKAEARVEGLEQDIAGLEEQLKHPGLYNGTEESNREAVRLTQEVQELKRQLDDALIQWTDAQEELEKLG